MPSDDVIRQNIKIGAKVAELREALGMTQEELARKVGYTASSSRSTIQKIEAGRSGIKQSKIALFADALDTSIAELMGWEEPNVVEEYVTFPIIAEAAAHFDTFAEYEDYTLGQIDIPPSWLKGRPKSDYFVIKVHGDSMYPTYQDGDLVLILRQSTMNYSGQIGIVMYDDNAGTLKRVEYVMGEDWMRLVPINPAYPPITIRDERLEHCRVLGIAKMVIREVH